MDCGVFTVNRQHLKRAIGKWRRRSCGYRQLSVGYNELWEHSHQAQEATNPAVTVVVGRERRVFKVDPHILQHRLFHPLLQMPTTSRLSWDPTNGLHPSTNSADVAGGSIVFLDCDAILFEHALWLVCNDDPSVPHLNLEVLMDFYAQDGA